MMIGQTRCSGFNCYGLNKSCCNIRVESDCAFLFVFQVSWKVYPVRKSSGIRLEWELMSQDVSPGGAHKDRWRLP